MTPLSQGSIEDIAFNRPHRPDAIDDLCDEETMRAARDRRAEIEKWMNNAPDVTH